jgi:hypothetical protein
MKVIEIQQDFGYRKRAIGIATTPEKAALMIAFLQELECDSCHPHEYTTEEFEWEPMCNDDPEYVEPDTLNWYDMATKEYKEKRF